MNQEYQQQDMRSPDPGRGSGDEVKRDFQGLLGSVRKFLSDLLNIRQNTDQDATKSPPAPEALIKYSIISDAGVPG